MFLDLCSLHGEVDRLAVSVIWTLSRDLETVKSVWYGRTVIHNWQAMTYDQAHNILHDLKPDEPGKVRPPPLTAGYPVDLQKVPQLKEDLIILRDLGRKLKKRREDVGGAVDLSSGDLGGELKFTLDENGNPQAVTAKKELEIHNTIAEMMIMVCHLYMPCFSLVFFQCDFIGTFSLFIYRPMAMLPPKFLNRFLNHPC